MKLRVVAVGKLRDAWLVEGCEEYAKRVRARLPLELVELRDDAELVTWIDGLARPGAKGPRSIDKAARAGEVWCLDERGQQLSSTELATQLSERMRLGAPWNLVIGGADGLPKEALARAARRWSLGRLTLPHRMVRLILLEQLYRALSIVRGEPYHRP